MKFMGNAHSRAFLFAAFFIVWILPFKVTDEASWRGLSWSTVDNKGESFEYQESLVLVGTLSRDVNLTCKRDEIKTLRHCDVIVDLQCPHRFRKAIYHRIVDCLAYEYAGIKDALSSYRIPCFAGYENRADLFTTLLGDNLHLLCSAELVLQAVVDQQILKPSRSQDINTRLPLVKPNRANNSRSIQLLVNDVSSRSVLFAPRTILLVKRRPPLSRSFSEQSYDLLHSRLKSLSLEHGRQLDVYDGTESVEETIQKFQLADAVVHYLGAAAANMAFARPGTHVIEITTYMKSDDSEVWRSNMLRLRVQRPDIKSYIFRIPLSHGWPNLNLSIVDEHEDAIHFIKHLQNVSLRISDVDMLLEIIRNAL